MSEKEMLEVVNKLHFKFAKTMANIPHWYVIKDDNNKYLYCKLHQYIKENHYKEKFYSKEYCYCNIGKYKYWYMDDNIEKSICINRTEI